MAVAVGFKKLPKAGSKMESKVQDKDTITEAPVPKGNEARTSGFETILNDVSPGQTAPGPVSSESLTDTTEGLGTANSLANMAGKLSSLTGLVAPNVVSIPMSLLSFSLRSAVNEANQHALKNDILSEALRGPVSIKGHDSDVPTDPTAPGPVSDAPPSEADDPGPVTTDVTISDVGNITGDLGLDDPGPVSDSPPSDSDPGIDGPGPAGDAAPGDGPSGPSGGNAGDGDAGVGTAFHTGGFVTDGDRRGFEEIPARLLEGETVMNQNATRAFNPWLKLMNDMGNSGMMGNSGAMGQQPQRPSPEQGVNKIKKLILEFAQDSPKGGRGFNPSEP